LQLLKSRSAIAATLHPGGTFDHVGGRAKPRNRKEFPMLYTIALILLILWALGLATSVTFGGLVHVLLVIAIVVVIFQLISGRKVL
jgi:hypothetical protein